MYREFAGETNFEKRCRLLLDLFKLSDGKVFITRP